MKITMEINEEQAHTLLKALDAFSRLHMGQLNIVMSDILISHQKRFEKEQLNMVLAIPKAILDLSDSISAMFTGMPPNASFSIGSPEIPDMAREAYDMQQVLRYKLAWEKNLSGGYTVNFQKPMKTSELDLPKVTIEK